MDIYSIYKLLLEKKWYIIIVPILTGVLALFLSGLMPKQYKSVAKLSTGFTTQSSINLIDERFDFRKSVLKFNNLIETMKSEMILSMVSYDLLLHDLNSETSFKIDQDSIEHFKNNVDFSILETKQDSFQILTQANKNDFKIKDILDSHGYSGWQIIQDLVIKRVRDTDYVIIEYIGSNPYLSAFIVNDLAKELIRYYTYTNSTLSNKSVVFFQGQVDQKKEVLDNKLSLVNSYKRTNPVKDEAERSALFTRLTQYEMLRDESSRTISTLQLSLAKNNNITNKNVTSNNHKINQRIVELRARISELTQLYIDTGSNDAQLEQTINNVRSQLTIEMKLLDQSNSVNSKSESELKAEKDQLEFDLKVERANLSRLYELIAQLKVQTTSFTTGSSNLEALERHLDDAMAEYQSALDKLNLEKSKSLLTASSISIAVKGQPKLEPESQKRKLIILFAVFTSFTLTVLIIIGFDFMDFRIKTRADFEKHIPLSLTGQLNKVDLNNFQISNIFSNSAGTSNENYKQLLRKLRHFIELSEKQSILVTSLNRNDGKTFFTLSLAYSLSLINKKVLIIDTNFKNNTLTKLLAPDKNFYLLNSAKNLSNTLLISDGTSAEEDRFEEKNNSPIMSPTMYKNIDIIGNNGGLESPLELFSARDFGSIISTLKSKYDYILMEGPSLNEYSDTMELVKFVDGVISVIKAGAIIKQKDRESITYLNSLNGQIMGGVLNQVEETDL